MLSTDANVDMLRRLDLGADSAAVNELDVVESTFGGTRGTLTRTYNTYTFVWGHTGVLTSRLPGVVQINTSRPAEMSPSRDVGHPYSVWPSLQPRVRWDACVPNVI